MVGYILSNGFRRIPSSNKHLKLEIEGNWGILSPKLSTHFIICLESVYRKMSKE